MTRKFIKLSPCCFDRNTEILSVSSEPASEKDTKAIRPKGLPGPCVLQKLYKRKNVWSMDKPNPGGWWDVVCYYVEVF